MATILQYIFSIKLELFPVAGWESWAYTFLPSIALASMPMAFIARLSRSSMIEVLNGVDRGTEKTILDSLEIQDPELADEIKKRMFVFEDIVTLDNRAIQRVIRDVENDDLLLSLKVASEEVKEIVFSNMSQRMVETFKEEMEIMGPVRLRDVEEAQSRIVGVVRKLEEAGEIVIARGGGDDIIV